MNKYNPNIHNRRSIRLKGYDYSQAGLYFVTICCQDRACHFGDIDVGAGFTPAQMVLNEFGQIAYDEWVKLSNRFPNFELDVFQIMPNHMHGIMMLNEMPVGAGFTTALYTNEPIEMNREGAIEKGESENVTIAHGATANRAGASPAPTRVSDIVGAYKSLVANGCLSIYKSKNETMGKIWQRNYYEHIIRNEQSYQTISDYIINNPAKWKDDKFYKE